jgi:uncharacterized protein (DUF2126 family)
MHNTDHLPGRALKPSDIGAIHPLDRPEEYEELSSAEQATLLEWIRLAIKPAKTPVVETSYGIKHDFEHATDLYVSNGQFKGAMLATGYAPVNPGEQNWRFRIRPTGKSSQSRDGSTYHIEHLSADEREDLAALARVADRAQDRRYEAERRLEQHPDRAS